MHFSLVAMEEVKENSLKTTFKDINQLPFNYSDVSSQGDWLYGQNIVEKFLLPSIDSIIIPIHYLFPLKEDVNLEKLVKEAYATQKVFAVKYSLAGNDFLGSGIRGGNSSRGRKIDMQKLSREEALSNIKGFIACAPSNCSVLVLQELINQTGGCLFHVEISKNNVMVDMLWEANISTGRAYFQKTNKKTTYEELLGIGHGWPQEREEGCKKIANKCLSILSTLEFFGDISWHLEGFWKVSDELLTVFQLRPTPPDRLISPIQDTKEDIYSTNFTWGCYDVGPLKLQLENIKENPEIFIRRGLPEELESSIVERISLGKQILLVDTNRGFVLSHEKYFLPQSNLRKFFGFIYIPEEVLAKYNGCMVKIISSEGKGYIVLN